MYKILLVEDNPIFRHLLRNILNKQYPSMIIEEAATSKEVLQKIKDFLPDLIFMDIKLPDGSGLQLTQEIKSTYPKIKIIILTNYDLPEYRDAALKHGANYFLCKSSSSSVEITKFVEHIVSGLQQ